MTVSRILHVRVRPQMEFAPDMRGGATVLVEGDASGVNVQVAFCHPKDVFCKKSGRTRAAAAPVERIPLRQLPAALGLIHKTVHKRAKVPFTYFPPYEMKIRDFLPKE